MNISLNLPSNVIDSIISAVLFANKGDIFEGFLHLSVVTWDL